MPPMPNVYLNQGPLRWQDDVTGALPRAVEAYLNHGAQQPVTAHHIEAVRQYCEYYINAPCWKTGKPGDGFYELFATLRERIKAVRTFEELDIWMQDALDVGIDPL